MSNNIFSRTRFLLLFKQHFIQQAQLMLLSAGAYVGVIFIVLSITQLGNNMEPHELGAFHGFLMAFVPIFAILYVGHSFPSFRSKESTINYLMLPASILEKFAFEFISRIGIVLLALPLLFWVTFNVQGFFFTIFTTHFFEPIGIQYTVKIDVPDEHIFLLYAIVTGGSLFALSLAFTGAAMFTKQPLVKTLFALAIVIAFFVGYSYLAVVQLGVGEYNPPEQMRLLPLEEHNAVKATAAAFFAATFVMLFVAYRKLKEREV